MGGGDLNLKKSWHPNTIKNQERVWKAEKAATLEKERIIELQKDREMERNKEELNQLIPSDKSSNEASLNWMYDKPNKKADNEEYLLGRSIGKNYDELDNKKIDSIPSVARRVAGSSMLADMNDSQVDMDRKLREDPLLLIKERERAARAAILNNPIQRRKIAELLRKEQEAHKNKKEKKKKKKKDCDLDDKLARKLSALGTNKNIDIATLLASDTSSSDDEVRKKKKAKKKNLKKEKKRKRTDKTEEIPHKKAKHESNEDSSSESYTSNTLRKRKNKEDNFCNYKIERKSHRSEQEKDGNDKHRNKEPFVNSKPYKNDRSEDPSTHEHADKRDKYITKFETSRQDKQQYTDKHSKYRTRDHEDRYRQENRQKYDGSQSHKVTKSQESKRGITEDEKRDRLAAMLAAGSEREASRGSRVAARRAADAAAERAPALPPAAPRALPDSLEARLHSNRHYIQRDHAHMERNFAKR